MSTAFAYALTRLHARIADRPGDHARRRLAAVDDFGHFLQLAARGGFKPWLTNLGTTSAVHAVEYALREAWRGRLDELAGWLPARWREPVKWLQQAPELPVLTEFLRHGRGPAWTGHDPRWTRLPAEPEALRRVLIERWPALEHFGNDELAQAWLAQARDLLPSVGGHGAKTLEALLKAQLEPARLQVSDTRWLLRVFRRDSSAPVKVFAYAGLERLDFEFLRGHLVRRRLQIQQPLAREAA
ncbi:MAG: hypothetical protein RQ741_14425 [Wenzhouxiangellaceae bacterium]|nr:hypothetical protein [Wenzhouxiangellaceae bacterium]